MYLGNMAQRIIRGVKHPDKAVVYHFGFAEAS